MKTAGNIGFIILSHSNPSWVRRLIIKLNRMFDFPFIVCHHDFSKCDFDTTAFPENVVFVTPHIATQWAGFSLVEATIRAIETMYNESRSPAWFVLLSGTDYPIAPASKILDDLQNSPYDAHINYEEVNYTHPLNERQKHLRRLYCSLRFNVHILNKKLKPTIKELAISTPWIAKWFTPFTNSFKCYSGWQWFCANRKSAEYILKFIGENPRFVDHYRTRKVSDESFFHTILCNAPNLKISSNNWRFIHWTPLDSNHPTVLTSRDLPRILASNCHFARKFDPTIDEAVLDELDAITEPVRANTGDQNTL